MKRLTPKSRALTGGILLLSISLMTPALAQLVDETQVTPTVPSGTIGKSLDEQVGAGRGDSVTPQSSIYLIQRDPARSIRRGRQLFQRKFTSAQGLGTNPNAGLNLEMRTTRNLLLARGHRFNKQGIQRDKILSIRVVTMISW
ncbi:hypothetical protein N9888_00695 [Akkermansiaceae bacterium]|nr:hypothetical protein [Akkermansiaceae bacterium]